MASGIGSMFNQYAQGTADYIGRNVNPFSFTVGGGLALGTGAALAGIGRARNTRPERIGEMDNAGFDTVGQPTEALKKGMQNWDEQQWQQYQNAAQETLQNQVRLGQLTPAQAQNRMNQMNFTFDGNGQGSIGDVSNSGQLQQSAMQSLDRPGPEDYTAQYGDPSSIGIEDQQYWNQLRNAAVQQTSLQQDVGDIAVSREFDRTMQFRRPVERDRNLEQFSIGQAQERNMMRRNMAQGLMNSYVNTAQSLITSGL
jgi:hypothetical protein